MPEIDNATESRNLQTKNALYETEALNSNTNTVIKFEYKSATIIGRAVSKIGASNILYALKKYREFKTRQEGLYQDSIGLFNYNKIKCEIVSKLIEHNAPIRTKDKEKIISIKTKKDYDIVFDLIISELKKLSPSKLKVVTGSEKTNKLASINELEATLPFIISEFSNSFSNYKSDLLTSLFSSKHTFSAEELENILYYFSTNLSSEKNENLPPDRNEEERLRTLRKMLYVFILDLHIAPYNSLEELNATQTAFKNFLKRTVEKIIDKRLKLKNEEAALILGALFTRALMFLPENWLKTDFNIFFKFVNTLPSIWKNNVLDFFSFAFSITPARIHILLEALKNTPPEHQMVIAPILESLFIRLCEMDAKSQAEYLNKFINTIGELSSRTQTKVLEMWGKSSPFLYTSKIPFASLQAILQQRLVPIIQALSPESQIKVLISWSKKIEVNYKDTQTKAYQRMVFKLLLTMTSDLLSNKKLPCTHLANLSQELANKISCLADAENNSANEEILHYFNNFIIVFEEMALRNYLTATHQTDLLDLLHALTNHILYLTPQNLQLNSFGRLITLFETIAPRKDFPDELKNKMLNNLLHKNEFCFRKQDKKISRRLNRLKPNLITRSIRWCQNAILAGFQFLKAIPQLIVQAWQRITASILNIFKTT